MDGIVLPLTAQRWYAVATFANATSRQQESIWILRHSSSIFQHIQAGGRVRTERHLSALDGIRGYLAAAGGIQLCSREFPTRSVAVPYANIRHVRYPKK